MMMMMMMASRKTRAIAALVVVLVVVMASSLAQARTAIRLQAVLAAGTAKNVPETDDSYVPPPIETASGFIPQVSSNTGSKSSSVSASSGASSGASDGESESVASLSSFVDPCAASPCRKDEECVASAHPPRCVKKHKPINPCDVHPCAKDQHCRPEPKQCIKAPCPQYVCLAGAEDTTVRQPGVPKGVPNPLTKEQLRIEALKQMEEIKKGTDKPEQSEEPLSPVPTKGELQELKRAIANGEGVIGIDTRMPAEQKKHPELPPQDWFRPKPIRVPESASATDPTAPDQTMIGHTQASASGSESASVSVAEIEHPEPPIKIPAPKAGGKPGIIIKDCMYKNVRNISHANVTRECFGNGLCKESSHNVTGEPGHEIQQFTWTCACKPGFFGPYCSLTKNVTEIVDCGAWMGSVCSRRGRCHKVRTRHLFLKTTVEYECACHEGYSGQYCTQLRNSVITKRQTTHIGKDTLQRAMANNGGYFT